MVLALLFNLNYFKILVLCQNVEPVECIFYRQYIKPFLLKLIIVKRTSWVPVIRIYSISNRLDISLHENADKVRCLLIAGLFLCNQLHVTCKVKSFNFKGKRKTCCCVIFVGRERDGIEKEFFNDLIQFIMKI